MRLFIVKACGFVVAAVLIPALVAAPLGPKGDSQAELKKLQGLWQHIHGGIKHIDGDQVVRGGVDGPRFFIHGDKLVWLDQEGKPSGEETITLDPAVNPKRIKFTAKGADGKEHVVREGIYTHGVRKGETAAASLTVHIALDGKPVPKRFLELNKPVKGEDGCEWLVSRCKLQGK
jgi:uncharacterized protein (TIGR03067 family)